MILVAAIVCAEKSGSLVVHSLWIGFECWNQKLDPISDLDLNQTSCLCPNREQGIEFVLPIQLFSFLSSTLAS